MSTKGEITEGTIARIAGNLLSGYACADHRDVPQARIEHAVTLARAIAYEVRRTTPKEGK